MEIASSILNQSIVKNSFDRLIYNYNNPTNEKLNLSSLNNTYSCTSGSKNIIQQKDKNSSKQNNIKFTQENFCDENCQNNFNKIMNYIKEGKIDINKIDWTKDGDNNTIKNLINYYYNMGYNQGSIDKESNQQSKNEI